MGNPSIPRKLPAVLSLVLLVSSGKVLADVAARVLSLQGQVEVERSPATPAHVGQLLNVGTLVRTGERSRAALLLVDETQLKVNANTELRLTEARHTSNLITRVTAAAVSDQSILNVSRGQVWLRSKQRPARVEVETPAVTAAIRGSELDIRVADDGESVATVIDGSIDFFNEFGRIIVYSGEQGRARIGEAPTKTVILNPRDAAQWTLYFSAAVSPRDYPFLPSPEPAAAPAIQRARELHDEGDLAGALAALDGFQSAEASEIRGWIYLAQNRVPEAVEELALAPTDSWRRRLGLSLGHYRLNEIEEAYRHLEDPEGAAQLRIQKAMLDLIAGDPARARELLESVVENDPFYSMAQGLLSSVHLARNEKDEALAAARRAVASNPGSPSALLSLSLVQQAFFDLSGATRSVERALELDPTFLQAQIQYARLLFGAGNTGKAETVIRDALALAPEEAAAHSVLGFIVLARGRTEEARAHFERSVALDSTSGEPRLGLGIASMRGNRTTEALADIMAAATLAPQMSLYQSYLAKAFYEERNFEQAFAALGAAMELDARDPTPHLYAGIFQNDLNRPGRAVVSFEESIRLNDNRAVYRSRFLLDEDRATRNVNLALAYNRLGLSEWGNSEALKSSLTDATNSGARLFLASTFLRLRGRTLAGGSELLLARLLLPVNPNSFNAFNDYTTLFELSRSFWTTGGSYGSFDSGTGSLAAYGGSRRFAYSSFLSYDRTEGFRPQNDDARAYQAINFFKFAPTPHSDLLLSYTHEQVQAGDQGTESSVVSEFNDPNRRDFFRINRVELGYHHQLRPGSDVVVYISGRDVTELADPVERLFFQGGVEGTLRRSLRTPNVSVQAAHLLKVSDWQFRYGFDMLDGRARTREVLNLLFPGDPPERFEQLFDATRKKTRFRTVFLQSDYLFTPNFIVTAGLTYDWSNDDNLLDERETPISRWNPQAGFLFSPTPSTTLRFAAARTLQTHFQERLAPTHLVGFPLSQNEPPLSESVGASAGWDQRLGRRTFVRTFTFRRKPETPVVGLSPEGEFEPIRFSGDLYGGGLVWNQFVTERWTLVPQYFLTHSRDFSGLRRDSELSLGLFYVDPSGYAVALQGTYLDQFGRVGQIPLTVKVFTADLSVSYELPGKLGRLSFRGANLFDRRYRFLVDPFAVDPRVPRRQLRFDFNFFF